MAYDQMQRKERIEFIDLLRGIAIFLMVLGHLLCNSDSKIMLGICNWIYSFHMPLLFWVSGYLLGIHRIGKSVSFIKKKAVHLLFPYLTGSALECIINGRIVNIKYFISYILGFETPGLWFFPVLFLLCICYLEFCLLTQKKEKKIIYEIFAIGMVWGSIIILAVVSRYQYLINAISYAIPFFFGVICARNRRLMELLQNKVLIISMVGIYIFIYPFFDFDKTAMYTQILKIVLFFCVFPLGIYCSNLIANKQMGSGIKILGRESLGIYLFHGYMLFGDIYCYKLQFWWVQLPVLIFYTGVVCALCIGIVKILRKRNITAKIFLGE